MSDIILTIPDWKHKRLLQRIDTLKNAMRMFKIPDVFKKAYLDDLFAIENIVKNNKTMEVTKNER